VRIPGAVLAALSRWVRLRLDYHLSGHGRALSASVDAQYVKYRVELFSFMRFREIALWWLVLWAGTFSAAASQIESADCLACHNDPDLITTVQGKSASLYIPQKTFQRSVHGVLNCTDCHTDVKSIPHQPVLAKPSCGSCHGDEQATYAQSVHGKAVLAGNTGAARCTNCHEEPHAILPPSDPASRVYHGNIPNTCGSCHRQKFVMSASGLSTQVFVSYEQSVHGRAVSAGSRKAAVCTDCHGAHDILMAGDPKSSTFKFNVPATCGKCHGQQDQQYGLSVHGQAISRGNWLAPVCTDCHGIHTIQAPGNPASSVSAQALAEITCARCHEGVRLSRELGVPGARVTSYLNSYHGLASKLGSTVVANCASCHGSHLILPSSDPRSSINKANLAVTCGKCHPGATAKFTRFPVHGGTPMAADIGSIVVGWIKRFYLIVIFSVIGGMILHNAVVWRSKAVARRKLEHHTVVRMTTNQRIQHLILFGSFAVLVLTGFALIPPFDAFADWIGITDPIRRTVHRTAGVTLIVTGIYHICYVFLSLSGRQMARALLPEPKDIRDLWGTLRYHLGLSQQKPQFGRFNYGEKFEYWALVWGTVVMACTGLMVWFQVVVTRALPGWWIDVALTIHLYEAILATLAILLWHLYQVMFDPDVYPMNWAWWNGRMSLEFYKDEHPLDPDPIWQAMQKETNGSTDEDGSGTVRRDQVSPPGSAPDEPKN
jgi:cytochrome b subunit of formate dehydrogenase